MQRWATSNALGEDGQPDPHVFQLGGGPAVQVAPRSENDISAAELANVVPPPGRSVAPVSAQAPAAKDSKPVTTAEVMRQLKARLRVVEREIKARKSLEAERDQIKRLIAAAKNERSNLRAIRATG